MDIYDFLEGHPIKIASGNKGYVKESDGKNYSVYFPMHGNLSTTVTVSWHELLNIIREHNPELFEQINKLYPEYLF